MSNLAQVNSKFNISTGIRNEINVLTDQKSVPIRIFSW